MAVTVGKTNRYQFQGLFQDAIPFQESDITLTAAAGAETSEDLTVPGARPGDMVLWGLVEDHEGATVTADVTANDTITVTLANATGSTITIAAAVFNGLVLRVPDSWPNVT